MPEHSGDIDGLLAEVGDGNVAAQGQLLELMYAELRRLARRYMRQERPTHTLQPTALVNEAYIRLLGSEGPRWQNRSHFLAHAARAMRQVLVDYARKHLSGKRGGHQIKVSLEAIVSESGEPPAAPAISSREADELLNLDAALTSLAALDSRQATIVELRFFGGLSDREIARSLGICERTVRRDWRIARLWLRRCIDRGGPTHDR